jgi:ssRNA-specific RNase YbeY (16S rRNA maturation enzyme)
MLKLDTPEIHQAIEEIVRKHGIVGDYEVNVFEATEEEMKELHHKYMADQGYEDAMHEVLSFPLEKEVGPDGIIRLGDIVICPTYIEKIHENTIELIKHSCIHLLGIHHEE